MRWWGKKKGRRAEGARELGADTSSSQLGSNEHLVRCRALLLRLSPSQLVGLGVSAGGLVQLGGVVELVPDARVCELALAGLDLDVVVGAGDDLGAHGDRREGLAGAASRRLNLGLVVIHQLETRERDREKKETESEVSHRPSSATPFAGWPVPLLEGRISTPLSRTSMALAEGALGAFLPPAIMIKRERGGEEEAKSSETRVVGRPPEEEKSEREKEKPVKSSSTGCGWEQMESDRLERKGQESRAA